MAWSHMTANLLRGSKSCRCFDLISYESSNTERVKSHGYSIFSSLEPLMTHYQKLLKKFSSAKQNGHQSKR